MNDEQDTVETVVETDSVVEAPAEQAPPPRQQPPERRETPRPATGTPRPAESRQAAPERERERQPERQPEREPRREPDERRFTQAELDERVGKARNEGRAAAYRYIGKELGVAVVAEDGAIDLTGLRTLVDQARNGNVEAKQRISELDARSQELLGQLGEKDNEIRGTQERARQALRVGEAKAAATALGFSDPADAIALLGDLGRFKADLETMQVDGLTEALQQLAQTKPYLIKQVASAVVPPAPIPATPAPASGAEQRAAEDSEKLDVVRRQARTFF